MGFPSKFGGRVRLEEKGLYDGVFKARATVNQVKFLFERCNDYLEREYTQARGNKENPNFWDCDIV